MRRPTLLCLLLTLLLAAALNAQPAALGSAFGASLELYQKGNLDELADRLPTLKASTNEESALLLYLNAMLKTGKAETSQLLQQAGDKYPATHYGQLSLLELAKIMILDRQIPQAQSLLQKINSAELVERYYWLAVCAEATDAAAAVISNAEAYLRLAPQGRFAEESHYLIAGAYQDQAKHQSGIATLNKLKNLPGFPRDQQYFSYRLGYLNELAKNPAEALENYRAGFELNRLSQVAFQIEDRLFELKRKFPSSVDLAFLYPYTELDIPLLSTAAADTTHAEIPPEQGKIRLDGKPSGGLYIQAGRFGVEANANKLSHDLRQRNLTSNYFQDSSNKSVPWVVVCGPYPTRDEAEKARQRLLEWDIKGFITQF